MTETRSSFFANLEEKLVLEKTTLKLYYWILSSMPYPVDDKMASFNYLLRFFI